MTAPGPCPRPVKRSRRLYVYWGVALALLAILGLVCWGVVAPVVAVHAGLGRCDSAQGTKRWTPQFRKEIEHLGGPSAAVCRLSTYLRLPKFAATRRHTAIEMLGRCGEPAREVLQQEFERQHDEGMKRRIASGLSSLEYEAARNSKTALEGIIHLDRKFQWVCVATPTDPESDLRHYEMEKLWAKKDWKTMILVLESDELSHDAKVDLLCQLAKRFHPPAIGDPDYTDDVKKYQEVERGRIHSALAWLKEQEQTHAAVGEPQGLPDDLP